MLIRKSLKVIGANLGLTASVLTTQAYESSLTLPKSVSRFRNVSVITRSISDTFNNEGKLTSLSDPLTQSISGSQIIEAKLAGTNPLDPSYNEYLQLNGLMKAMNQIDPDQKLGDLFQVDVSGSSSVEAQRYFFGYEYGYSDTLSIGLSIPVVRYDIHANAQAKLKSNAAAISQLQTVKDLGPKVLEAANRIEASAGEIEAGVLKAAFENKGYQRPHDFSYVALGELELGGKKSWMSTALQGFATQLGVRVPTASRSKDYSNIFDPGAGENQWDIYGVAAYDIYPLKNLKIGAAAKYTLQLADQHYMPVQHKGEEGLPDLKDDYVWDNVKRDLGDSFDYEISTHYSFWKKRFEVSGLYLYQKQFADKYHGNKALDYDSLGKNTAKSAQGYEIGLKFSTVEDVLQNRMKIPVDLRFAFNDTFAGKNSLDTQFYRLDFALYFK